MSAIAGGDEHLVLVGIMGSGKTSVGRVLARRLGRSLVDTDDEIERATGRTVREIWKADGEAAFRVLETDVLRRALATPTPAVIAAAGGVVIDAVNRELLRSSAAFVGWLRVEPEQVVARATGGSHRPLLDDDPLGRLQAMATERADWYADVADVTIDVGSRDVDAVAAAVLAALEEHAR